MYSTYRFIHFSPTRRSSDLVRLGRGLTCDGAHVESQGRDAPLPGAAEVGAQILRPYFGSTRKGGVPPLRLDVDRKSTRLNSSHANISYAVFCLKKKKNRRIT